MTSNHESYMQQCIALARQALQHGDPPVGAILVCQTEILGRGVESGRSTNDVTNHAEIIAIRDAIANGKQHQLEQATLYTTHEPCIMCSYAIRHYRIPCIVYGVAVNHVGGATSRFKILSTEDVPQWSKRPVIVAGILEKECQILS